MSNYFKMEELMKNQNEVVIGKTRVSAEDGLKFVRKLVRDETVLIRVDKARKSELEKRAKRAGVSLSSYVLMAEDKYSRMGEKGKP
jgi:hypothetical protein